MAPFIVPLMRCSCPVPLAEKHPQSIMFPPPCLTVGMVFLGVIGSIPPPPNTASWVDAKELDFGLIWPQHFHPVLLWIIQMFIGKLQTGMYMCWHPWTALWSGHSGEFGIWLIDWLIACFCGQVVFYTGNKLRLGALLIRIKDTWEPEICWLIGDQILISLIKSKSIYNFLKCVFRFQKKMFVVILSLMFK